MRSPSTQWPVRLNYHQQSKHHCGVSKFGASLAIDKAYLALVKTSHYGDGIEKGVVKYMPGQNCGPLVVHLHEALMYVSWAVGAKECIHGDAASLLDEYERLVECSITQSQTLTDGTYGDSRLPFREEVMKHDLGFYIAQKLADGDEYLAIFERSPLFAALMPPVISWDLAAEQSPDRRMVEILLEYGLDPGEGGFIEAYGIQSPSPWEIFIKGIIRVQVRRCPG